MISHSRCASFKLSINEMMNSLHSFKNKIKFNKTNDKMSKDNQLGYNQYCTGTAIESERCNDIHC